MIRSQRSSRVGSSLAILLLRVHFTISQSMVTIFTPMWPYGQYLWPLRVLPKCGSRALGRALGRADVALFRPATQFKCDCPLSFALSRSLLSKPSQSGSYILFDHRSLFLFEGFPADPSRRRQRPAARCPPSTTIVEPVIYEEAGPASSNKAPSISAGSAIRRWGIRRIIAFPASLSK